MRSRSARRCAAAPWLGPRPPYERGALLPDGVLEAPDAAVTGSRKASKSALVKRSAPFGAECELPCPTDAAAYRNNDLPHLLTRRVTDLCCRAWDSGPWLRTRRVHRQ